MAKVSDVMQRNVTVVSEDDTVGMARQLMLWLGVRHMPVLRSHDSRPVGVFSERDLLSALTDSPPELVMARPVRELMTAPAEHIHPNAELADAAADLNTKRIGCLLVVDAGALVGIVTAEDILGELAVYPVEPEQPPDHSPLDTEIASLMYPEPIAVHPDDHLLDAAAKLAQARVRHACVVDGGGKVIGILSDRDVRRVIGDPSRVHDRSSTRFDALRVQDAMTPRPRTIGQDEGVRAALDALLIDRVGALPVVDDDGRLRGIVSYVDVLQHLADAAGTPT